MAETSFEREVLDRLTKIEVKLDSYEKIKEQVYDNQREAIKMKEDIEKSREEIKELCDKNKWLSRSVLGAVITCCVGVLFTYIKLGMGV